MFYELAVSTWGDEEIAALPSRDRQRAAFTMGENVAKLRSRFRPPTHGMKYAVMVNSGSSANLDPPWRPWPIHKKDKPLQRGDEVIVPADLLGHDLSPAAAVWDEAAASSMSTSTP